MNWNRKIKNPKTEAEADFARLTAEDEGCEERAERMVGRRIDAERLAAHNAAFAAEWNLATFTARRAKWNAASGNFAERAKTTGISYADLAAAKHLLGVA